MLAVVIGFVDTSNLLRRRSMPEFFEKVKKRLKKNCRRHAGCAGTPPHA
jgi:transposase